MRIGIDVTPLTAHSPGGIGTSLYETLRALTQLETPHDFTLYACGQPHIPFSDASLPFDLPLHMGTGVLAKSNIAWLQFGVASLLNKDAIDVFWGTRHVLPVNAPATAKVATAYDFWHVEHPEQQPLVNRTLNRYVVSSMMKHAHVVTAISDATADQARRLFPQAAGRVRTVLLGVDGNRFRQRSDAEVQAVRGQAGISGDYILAMDVFNPRKNFEGVLRAAALVPGASFQIVALGKPRATAAETDVFSIAAGLGLGDRVLFVGDVDQEQLVALYSGAKAFVYLSYYEGFGMPILEAMAAGCPVICSDTSSLPQVAGGAAVMVAPSDADAAASALSEVLADDSARQRLVSAGLARAQELSWERTAQGMIQSFEDAAAVAGKRAR